MGNVSTRIRQRLQISHDTHVSVIAKFEAQLKAIAHLTKFRFEFNENVTDAYAGHDTFLNFRYTNQSADDFFKVSLYWDDPDTERIDLKTETKSLVKPMSSVTLGASAIFDRIGIKEISDLRISVTDQLGDSATFRAEPFSFKVANPNQRVTQNISTHNQISIEGRGVVDASGMGSEQSKEPGNVVGQAAWRELKCSYLPAPAIVPSDRIISADEDESSNTPQASVEAPNEATEPVPLPRPLANFEAVAPRVDFDRNNLLSVFKAVEQGDAAAQNALGEMYARGEGVVQSYEQALDWFQKAASQGNASAQYSLGRMFSQGEAVSRNTETAAKWYRTAAEQGNSSAQCELAVFYQNGVGVAQNYDSAVLWFKKSSEQGNAEAQYRLGYLHQHGLGVVQSDEQALQCYRNSAQKGFADAQYELGVIYELGRGLKRDDSQAFAWFKKAAEQGNPSGQDSLGRMYELGSGVEKSDEIAVSWYRRAAEQGFDVAQCNLAQMYRHGYGVVQSDDQAAAWCRKAVDQGNMHAQALLGEMYEYGKGVAKNSAQAAFWYEKSAQQNYSEAEFNLGRLYLHGIGVEQNDEQAVFWFRRSANQGDPRGQFMLGWMYDRGRGVAQSDSNARQLYEQAAAQNYEPAVEELKRIEVEQAFLSESEIEEEDVDDEQSEYEKPVEVKATQERKKGNFFVLLLIVGGIVGVGVYFFMSKSATSLGHESQELSIPTPVFQTPPPSAASEPSPVTARPGAGESTGSEAPVTGGDRAATPGTTEENASQVPPSGEKSVVPGMSALTKETLEDFIKLSSSNDWSAIDSKLHTLTTVNFPVGDKKLARELNKAGLAFFTGNEFDKAITEFEKASQANRGDIEVRNNLGYAELRAGHYDKAAGYFIDTLIMDPTRANAWSNLAELLAERGYTAASTSALRLAVHFSRNKTKTIEFLSGDPSQIPSEKLRQVISAALPSLKDIPSLSR
jgi:TPR repeat protein